MPHITVRLFYTSSPVIATYMSGSSSALSPLFTAKYPAYLGIIPVDKRMGQRSLTGGD